MKSKMMKRYEDGGEVEGAFVEAGSGPSEDSSPMEKSESSAKPEYKSFKEAFAAERKAGNKTFEYMGKKYTTDMAPRDTGSDVARMQARAPKPALRAETNDDRAKRYVEKRAAARAEAAANAARGRSGVKMANGGVVKRATATMRGKAC
jgi:hypothetical protein